MRNAFLVTCLTLLLPASVPAHYNMLLLQAASIKKSEAPVTLTYQWGHPFEHELFDAPLPESLVVLGPDGKTTDLLKALKPVLVAVGKKKVTTYELAFTPEEPGDYVFLVKSPPIWMEAEGEYFQDTAKVVLHVQAQKGWDRHLRADFEFIPLTRPYGLRAGTVFQAQLHEKMAEREDFPLVAGSVIEIEHYNPTAPKTLPEDEFMTRTVKTDRNGVVTCDLPEAGWWCLTAARDGGTKLHDGKMAPVRQRSTFWVYVNEKTKP